MENQDDSHRGRPMFTGYLIEPTEPPKASVPIAKLIGVIFQGWRVWLITGFIGGVIGVALALSMEREYRSSAVVSIDTQEASLGSGLSGQLSGIASLAGLSLGGVNRRLEYLAVLQSRALADQFIREKNLKILFFAKSWDEKNKRWTSKKIPSDDDAYRYFSSRVCSIDEDRRTALVTISMQWQDRVAAANWASLYIQRANDLLRARAMQEATSSLEFLDRELVKASSIEIRQSMFQLVEAQKKQQMLATVRKDFIFHIIDPPVVSAEDKYVSPRRRLIAVTCAFFGGAIGIAIVLFRGRRKLMVNEAT